LRAAGWITAPPTAFALRTQVEGGNMISAGAAPAIEHGPRESAVANLLIVDDERAIREGCREAAQAVGYNAFVADSAEHAYRVMDTQSIDVVLLDLKLPGAGGLEALRQIKSRRPDAIIIVITGYATVQSAVQAMKFGAYEYLTKPFSLEELKVLLEHVADDVKMNAEKRVLREKLRWKQGFGSIVGRSPEMEKLYRIIAKAAQSTHPVLILGESGTGKELVARSIHFSGPFKDKPFIPVDCGSLVPTLIESELFGYVKGAFTGAQRSKDGLLAIADGGTVFLDEVGELPIDLQAKLLRAIQEHEIRPVGSTKRVPINVRILAATNRDLEAAVAEGRFRRDLYFRLNVLTLRIPALRERKQDIPLLAAHILERLSRTTGGERSLSDEALKAILAYDWPGNVRELENCLERACTMSSGPVLHVADLSSPVQNAQLNSARAGVPTGPRIVPIADLEKQAILSTIDQLNGDKLLAAKLLGIGKTTLYRKLKEYASQD
jgi:DNA-binding NtrC family response regulator